jgi:hypothetical protein
MESKVPYSLGDELKTGDGRRTLETESHVKIANLAHVEGLRMAAEMFRDSQWVKFKESVPIDGYGFYQSILSKAKEIEESAK